MILLVSPPLSFDRRDPLTTGIVYMPIGLAYLAAALRRHHEIDMLDVFGEAPETARTDGDFVILGLSDDEVARRFEASRPDVVVAYANQVANHEALLHLIRLLRSLNSFVPIVVAENTQAVTAYSVGELEEEFLAAGATSVIVGEPELGIAQYVSGRLGRAEAEAIALNKKGQIADLDALDFPAWDLLPLANYWNLGFGHGPVSEKRYLPLLTSRGCPYPCKFCVVPTTNERRWRPRSADSVVDEMATMVTRFGVTEFHLEDLNPTIKDQRMREIAEEILRRDLKVTWKIVAGTKIETIKSVDTLELMRKSGLRYLSMSPESGSARLLSEIGKPFDQQHAMTMVKASRRLGIRTQACFVLGYPGESRSDLRLTSSLLRRLSLAGIDEVALFIASPIPGSEFASAFAGQYESAAELTFSPMWRSDFRSLQRTRLRLYATFLLIKCLTRPMAIARQVANFRRRRFETKMEMVPYRALRYRRLLRQQEAGGR